MGSCKCGAAGIRGPGPIVTWTQNVNDYVPLYFARQTRPICNLFDRIIWARRRLMKITKHIKADSHWKEQKTMITDNQSEYQEHIREFKNEDSVHTEEWDPVKTPRKSNLRKDNDMPLINE